MDVTRDLETGELHRDISTRDNLRHSMISIQRRVKRRQDRERVEREHLEMNEFWRRLHEAAVSTDRRSQAIATWTRNHGIPTFQYFGGSPRIIFSHAMHLYTCAEPGCLSVGYKTFPYCDVHYKTRHRVEIRRSTLPHAGDGLFALQTLYSGHRLPYTGELLTMAALDARYGDDNNTAPYAYDLNGVLFVDSALRRCTAAWANHREEPNCLLHTEIHEDGEERAFLEITHNINEGSELFLDYGAGYDFRTTRSRIVFIQESEVINLDDETEIEVIDLDEEIVDLNQE